MEKKYSYQRFGCDSTRVGQAVYDIISKEQPNYTAEEMLEEMGKGIVDYIQKAAEEGCQKFDKSFYLIHTFKKTLSQFNVSNTMQQKAVCFISGPVDPGFYMKELPHAAKTLYLVDKINGLIKLIWTVPGIEDCRSIIKNPDLYDRDLVVWVKDAMRSLHLETAS